MMLGYASLGDVALADLGGVGLPRAGDYYGGNIFVNRKKKSRESDREEEPEIERSVLPYVEEDEPEEELLIPEWMLEPEEDDDDDSRKRRLARMIRYLLLIEK